MFAWIRHAFWVLLGFLLIGLFIWLAGPYFGFGDYRPLETVNARLIALGVVIGCWLLRRLVRRVRAFRASDRLLSAVIAQPQPEPAATPSDVVKLRTRFEEGVAALKQQRRSGHSLYELPWYVIIGAPGSGKTTALLNSGLKLPLEQRGGKAALRGVGGTRNCDWWFTDDAIFLDTAGRYTSQDSDPGSDSAGWSEFLTLLRRYRERRPVNGVILTINAQDLLSQGGSVLDAHVDAARHRLDELTRELRIQLPVYVMVTKCDLVAGFVEYFEDLNADGRAQVWGVTFPYEQTLSNDAARAFPGELDALVTRLNERVFARLNEVRDVRRRAKVFGFPQQMAAMRESLTQFVTEVFDTTQFDRQVLLRGVYFTSGTQLGTPIDRLLGSLGRRFGASDVTTGPAGPAKTYFVERLLKDVLIGESGLAGVNRRLEARKAALQLGAYAATGLVAATGVAALSFAYTRNRDYLDQTATEIATVEQMAEVTPTSPPDRMVERFDAIKAIVDSAEGARAATWLPMRWGLYQAGAIGASAREAYRRELDSVLLPQFATRVQSGIHTTAGDPERLFGYVKAYQMLRDPRRLDKGYVQNMADAEWKPAGTAGAALSQHFHNLLESSRTPRPLPLDATLAAQALNSLRPFRARIAYDQIKRTYGASNAQGVRLDEQALEIDKVFRRASGTPLSTPVPAIYTKPVFIRITQEGLGVVAGQLASDGWVWGESPLSATNNAAAILSGVMSLYETDYVRAWEDVLNDLELVPLSTVAQVREVLRILTAPTSPLRGVLQVVAANTGLTETTPASKPSGVIAGAGQSASDTFNSIVKSLPGATAKPIVDPGRMVTASFQSLRDLSAGEPGKTRLDEILLLLGQIRQQLELLGPDVAGSEPMQILTSPQFRGLVLSLRQQADTLPYSLRTIVSQLAGISEDRLTSDMTRSTEALYRQQVVQRCQAVIANRYPFANTTAREVQLADFVAMFGPDGVFDRFFKDNLQTQVDTSGNKWLWRPGAVRMPTTVLDQFQAALRLRSLFFANDTKTPSIDFLATATDLDRDTARFVLEVDGQRIEYKHELPIARPLVWPGPSPGAALVAFENPHVYTPPMTYGGPWAWLKLIDRAMEGGPDAQQRIRLSIRQGTHSVIVTTETPRAGLNPFATRTWRQFSCES